MFNDAHGRDHRHYPVCTIHGLKTRKVFVSLFLCAFVRLFIYLFVFCSFFQFDFFVYLFLCYIVCFFLLCLFLSLFLSFLFFLSLFLSRQYILVGGHINVGYFLYVFTFDEILTLGLCVGEAFCVNVIEIYYLLTYMAPISSGT